MMKTLYDTVWKKYEKKPKPILFNAEMVRAILNGRKTQTRRPVKKQPPEELVPFNWCAYSSEPKNIGCFAWGNDPEIPGILHYAKPPYKKGDILYVRETWCTHENKEWVNDREVVKWRPSIHMPKKAARIFLKVTGISVERLQDITTENAISEGVREEKNSLTDPETKEERLYIHYHDYSGRNNYCTARASYKYLWNNLYASKGYSWNDNPWVWAIEFERNDDGSIL